MVENKNYIVPCVKISSINSSFYIKQNHAVFIEFVRHEYSFSDTVSNSADNIALYIDNIAIFI